jgi:hypothetical protein
MMLMVAQIALKSLHLLFRDASKGGLLIGRPILTALLRRPLPLHHSLQVIQRCLGHLHAELEKVGGLVLGHREGVVQLEVVLP